MDILQQFKNRNSVILVCETKDYKSTMLQMYKDLATARKKICVVAASTPSSMLIDALKKEEVDYSRMLFIDGVDAEHQGPEKCQCIHLGTVQSLTNVCIAINKSIDKTSFDLVIVDSISTVLLYNSGVSVARCIHEMVTSLRKKKVKFLGVILSRDVNGPLKELELFTDSIVFSSGDATNKEKRL